MKPKTIRLAPGERVIAVVPERGVRQQRKGLNMTWTDDLVRGYMQSEWANHRRALNEPQAREELLAGARLYCYEAGSSAPTPMFQDAARTTCYPNPLVLDSSGNVGGVVFPSAPFCLRLHGREGTVIAAADNCGAGFVA